MRRFLLGAVAILAGLSAANAGVVNAGQATVAGTVRDAETGEPLAGAAVLLTDLDRTSATDPRGRYVLPQVPAGPHHVDVRFIGYAHHSLHALVPRDGQLEINVSLRPEPIRMPTIEVIASQMIRGVDGRETTTFPNRECSIAAVRNHPLLGEPDVFQALGGGEVVLRPESPSGVHVRGGASDQTAYLLDGIPVFNPYHTAGVSSAWNPDAISRLYLMSAAPSLASPHALSGTIEGVTRAPGARLQAQGSVSSTQGRLTLDGPLGSEGAGYVVSLRSGLHDVIAPQDEPSYLRGETADWLAKVEVPAFGGRVRLLGYDSENDINGAATAGEGSGPSQDARRNIFEWKSRSLGAEWRRVFSSTAVRALGWSARGDAGSIWDAQKARIDMASARRDQGLLVGFEHRSERATTVAEMRVEEIQTSYRVESDSAGVPALRISATTPVATALAQHARPISRRLELKLAATLAAARSDLHAGPRAELRCRLSEQLTLSGSYARTHQFAQSLRNAESVVGNVFPVDLYMVAGAPGVPVAWSDQGVIAADYRPWAGVRLGVQAYERTSGGLVLVAPQEGQPFTTGAFTVGSGAARGASADLALSTARFGIVASYGLQRVRLKYGGSSYVPDHGTKHLLEGGVTVLPTPTLSVRLGGSAALGRRTTTISGGLEWEACNLLDQGCEFGGSPYYSGEPLGATELPAYFRVDLGVRKHWQLEVGGRDALIGVFGTVTNILGRKNVLTYAREPSTGELTGIEMRPVSPLVAGLDWRF